MNDKPRGLRSINESRDARGQSKYGRTSPNFWLFCAGSIVVVLIVYAVVSGRKLDGAKDDLLSEQRSAVMTVGKEWVPLRDKLEKITLDEAATWNGDSVMAEASTWDFRTLPGIYLRMRQADARNVESLRTAANDSLRDGFTTCLLRTPTSPNTSGATDAGSSDDHPWNMRQAYQATRVLTDAWADEVKASDDELRLRVFQQQYEKAKTQEIPLAIDIIKRARFFLLVLDEDVAEAKVHADGGVIDEEALQLVTHPSRVVIVNLENGATLARVRRSGEARVLMAGEHIIADPETRDAVTRQVNNCALAQSVWQSVHGSGAPAPSSSSARDAGTTH